MKKKIISIFLSFCFFLSFVFLIPFNKVSADSIDDYLISLSSSVHSEYINDHKFDFYLDFIDQNPSYFSSVPSGSSLILVLGYKPQGYQVYQLVYFWGSSFSKSNISLENDSYFYSLSSVYAVSFNVNNSGLISPNTNYTTSFKSPLVSSFTDGTTSKKYLYNISYSSDLNFTFSPDLTVDTDLSSLDSSLNISVDNPSSSAYDYMFYVSSSPSSSGIVSSLNQANFISSSNQWCYTKQTSSTAPSDLVSSLVNGVSDSFSTTDIVDLLLLHNYNNLGYVAYNVFGGAFNAASTYLNYKDETFTFYSLTQSNCPVYLINSGDSKNHIIPFSSFNIQSGGHYYFNIVYRVHDQSMVGAIGNSASLLVSEATGTYSYPVFDSSLFSSYISYSSTEFSFTSGYTSNPQNVDIRSYGDLIYNSNPDNSSAYIDSSDNSVVVNNNYYGNSGSGSGNGFSYDPSCSTNYLNYGTIYHGCTIYNYPSGSSGSSGSGSSSSSIPDLPESDFNELYSESGDFFDFIHDVFESSGWIPVSFFASAAAIALFMRIWGR